MVEAFSRPTATHSSPALTAGEAAVRVGACWARGWWEEKAWNPDGFQAFLMQYSGSFCCKDAYGGYSVVPYWIAKDEKLTEYLLIVWSIIIDQAADFKEREALIISS